MTPKQVMTTRAYMKLVDSLASKLVLQYMFISPALSTWHQAASGKPACTAVA